MRSHTHIHAFMHSYQHTSTHTCIQSYISTYTDSHAEICLRKIRHHISSVASVFGVPLLFHTSPYHTSTSSSLFTPFSSHFDSKCEPPHEPPTAPGQRSVHGIPELGSVWGNERQKVCPEMRVAHHSTTYSAVPSPSAPAEQKIALQRPFVFFRTLSRSAWGLPTHSVSRVSLTENRLETKVWKWPYWTCRSRLEGEHAVLIWSA